MKQYAFALAGLVLSSEAFAPSIRSQSTPLHRTNERDPWFLVRLSNHRHDIISTSAVRSVSSRRSRGQLDMAKRANGENFSPTKPRPGSMAEAIVTQGRVPYGEESRKYRRTVFLKQDDWIAHRSSFSIAENLRGGLFSGIIRTVSRDVTLVTACAITLVLYNGLIGNMAHETLLPHFALPVAPFTLSSPALGLLLVFRTNTSYARWLEARTLFSRISTHTVNLSRMACTFSDVSDPEKARALQELLQLCWALPRCLMNRLSGPEDEATFVNEIQAAFDDDKSSPILNYIVSAQDRPMAALMELSLALNALPIDDKRRLEMDKSVIILGECVESCERIYTSPVPLVYTRHTGRFLSLWMLLLPFPLYDVFVERGSILTEQVLLESCVLVPAVAILAIFLFGVQELSIQLEEPFSILPMQKFCDDIRSTATSMQTRVRR